MSFKITKPIKIIETFSGVGTFSMALRDLQVPHEIWKTSDWDVNAVKSYKAIHFSNDNTDYSEGMNKEDLVKALFDLTISTDGKNPLTEQQIWRKGEKWLRETYNAFKATHNLGSITNIHAEDLEIKNHEYTYLLSYSFPCTDLSLAGKRQGMDKDSGTHSALIWEIERILKECKKLNCLPDILIMENVCQIHSNENTENWNTWLSILEELGYKSYYEDLNAKNYGIAQNRLRCFNISVYKDFSTEPYEFPEPILLTTRLKHYLEDKVDEKYYINTEKADNLIKNLIERGVI